MTAHVTSIDKKSRVNWITVVVFALFHVGALMAPFYFEWRSVIVAAVMYWICISGGIGMGYHRLLTHRSYKVAKPLEYAIAVLGTMNLEGGPIFWVATHRVHHAKSDKPGDPHTPREGPWWAHIGWMIYGESNHNRTEMMARMAPDLGRDPFYRWLNTWHWLPLAISGVILFWWGGMSALLWAGFFRVTLGLHATWLVNSATHLWGSKRFATTDDSRNNWWVAMLTFGEGWHNNHHAHPASARHGLAWYELDVSWLQIRLLEKLGIAKSVKVAKVDTAVHEEQEAAA